MYRRRTRKMETKITKLYIGSQEHFEDEINAYYDQKKEMDREMQKQYEKEMMEEMERDYYEQQPFERI